MFWLSSFFSGDIVSLASLFCHYIYLKPDRKQIRRKTQSQQYLIDVWAMLLDCYLIKTHRMAVSRRYQGCQHSDLVGLEDVKAVEFYLMAIYLPQSLK